MVQRVHVVLEDDIDHSPADETVSFALDGVSYEIDLSTKNADKLREVLAPWASAARKVSGRRTAGRKANKGASADSIRAWATAQGKEINSRGRIPADIREAYEAAHRS